MNGSLLNREVLPFFAALAALVAAALLVDAVLRQIDGQSVESQLLRTDLMVRGSSVRAA